MAGQELVKAADRLPALVTGDWSEKKHFYIHRLADIFSTGMKRRWQHRCLIDLFAGPGKCVIENSDREVDGSPLQVVDIRDKFTDYYFNDVNPASIAALRTRLATKGVSPNFITRDCNDAVNEIRRLLPPEDKSIELTVIDPWGWELNFEALANLTEGRKMDLIVTFPIGFMKRNWKRELDQMDRFLGGDSYRTEFHDAMSTEPKKAARILLNFFENRLADIGYRYPSDWIWVSNSKRVKMYQMVFASKHPRGKEFWEKVSGREPSGQARMGI